MIECEAITRKWGNSIGITLPKNEDFKENEKVQVLIIKQKNVLKKTFGMAKGKLKKSTQQLKDEIRKELHHD